MRCIESPKRSIWKLPNAVREHYYSSPPYAQRHGTVSSRHVDIEKAAHFVRLFLVGVARFELAALRSRTVRATKLRYTPIMIFNYVVSSQNRNVLLCLVARLALTEGFADVSLFGVLPVSRCVAPSLPLPYATQTALHPDCDIQLCCYVPKQERALMFGGASRAHRRFCPRALRAANAQLY